MFNSRSRYYKTPTDSYLTADGMEVVLVRFPMRERPPLRGYHPRQEGQRLDQIAAHFLKDATRAWQLCDANGVLSPDALAARQLIGIPTKK
ncbi:hypothetical protein AAU61_13185 [Desulfocarbo indianensis]|nr:hypothetical protein AAU61_13185 [Desulfocarbo indianensis]